MTFFRNAFSVDFATPEKILYPDLDPNRTVGFIPLAWKDQMLEEDVFGITYTAYWTLWQRVLLVGGLRTKLKPYSVRVGAGNRLDGKLTPAIRSYVFGNTDSVFRRSYIPVDLPHDLMGIAYGPVAGENQDAISFLHHAFTKRDDCAPVYISKEEFKSFEDRDDIKEWRRQRAALPDLQSEEAKKRSVFCRRFSILKTFSKKSSFRRNERRISSKSMSCAALDKLYRIFKSHCLTLGSDNTN
ncbi:hypothetical protein ACHAO7_011330 [Fusarium culmorum]